MTVRRDVQRREVEMKRQGDKLTAVKVRAATAPGLYGDGHGLYLQVSAFDTKSWVFRYQIDGVARKMGLGPIHTVSLAEARKRAADARLKALDGIDPIDEHKARRAARRVEAAKALTFKQCADAYIMAHESGWKNEVHRNQWRASFHETRRGSRVFPAATAAINDLPVAAIDTALVVEVLEPIWYITPETASRIRGRIENVLAWATVRGLRVGDNPARWSGHLKELLPAKAKVAAVVHYQAVPYRDLPAFMSELRARPGTSARALEFTVLTAARSGETIGAKWAEVDLAAKVWTAPAARMKGGREHRVPLSDRAIAILESLPREGEYVFGKGKPLSQAMRKLARSMLGMGATVHGFRSTFRDWASEQTSYPHEMCELALAHAVGSKVEAAYRRGDMMEKRRRLMADWAAYCERPPAERSNIVPIREAAR
jgi:integrase